MAIKKLMPTRVQRPVGHETSPLLHPEAQLNRAAVSLSDKPVWKDRYKLGDTNTRESRRRRLREFILDEQKTAGLGSDRTFIRVGALTWHNVKAVILSDNVNFFLMFLPLGIISGLLKWDPAAMFILNFFAIIPLASLVSFATRVNFVGRLLHAILGNTTEIVVVLAAVITGQFDMAMSFLVGMISNNMLLVGGSCFLLGGIRNMRDAEGRGIEQEFATLPAKIATISTLFTTVCLVIPEVLESLVHYHSHNPDEAVAFHLLMTRVSALLRFAIYVFYICLSLRTHREVYDEYSGHSWYLNEERDRDEDEDEDGKADETPASPVIAVIVLPIAAGLLFVCAGNLLGATDVILERQPIDRAFISFILVPSACSTARNIAAVDVATADHMDVVGLT
ncbi:hypothetical protein PG984_014256 [Apiospora sp. TS-2023a]